MSNDGIFAVNRNSIMQVSYANAEQLAKEICDLVKVSQHAATISTGFKWWAKAVVSPYVGPATNWSIGYPEYIEASELVAAIEAQGLYVSYFDGYTDFAVVDTHEYEEYSCLNCHFPEN